MPVQILSNKGRFFNRCDCQNLFSKVDYGMNIALDANLRSKHRIIKRSVEQLHTLWRMLGTVEETIEQLWSIDQQTNAVAYKQTNVYAWSKCKTH
jgi:hypothetical protein